jgi:hypothetical protein
MRTRQGQPVTPEMVEALADEAERGYDAGGLRLRRIGRPSLAGAGESPRVSYRVSPATYARALKKAKRGGVATISALSRALLEAYADGVIELPSIVPKSTRAGRRRAAS